MSDSRVLPSRMTQEWMQEPSELSSHAAGVVISFLDVFAMAPPTRLPIVELLIEQTILDRSERPISIAGVEQKEFVPTGLRSSATLGGNVTFAALVLRAPRPGVPVVRSRYRIAIEGAGVIARDDPATFLGSPPRSSAGLDFDFAPSDTSITTRTVLLYPAPTYRFPSFVPTLRGTYTGHRSATPLLVRAVAGGPDGTPSVLGTDQSLTSYGFFGRPIPTSGSTATETTLPFSIGLRGGRRPIRIEVVDPTTGAVIAQKAPPNDVTDLLIIP